MIKHAVFYCTALAVSLGTMASPCEQESSKYPAQYPQLVEVVKHGKTYILEGTEAMYFSYLAIDLIKSSDINLGDPDKRATRQHPYTPFIAGNRAHIVLAKPISAYIKANNGAVRISEIELVFHREVKTNQRVQLITQEDNGKKEYTKYHAGHILYALTAIIDGMGRITPAES